MQSEAMRLKEEEEELARKNVKTQFDERLKNPTAGSRNLLRVLEGTKASPGSPSSPAAMKSITAKDLLQQHKQQLQTMKESQIKAGHIAATSPQLGRGLGDCQQEIDLSEVFNFASF